MPFKDGTGPEGQGLGRGGGRGFGRASGKGRQPGGFGLGPGGECVCPKCGTRAPHQRGIPCYKQTCPKCGNPMARV